MKITWRNSGPRRRVSRADQAVLSVGVGNRTVRSIFLSFLLLLFVNIINNNTNSLTPLIYISPAFGFFSLPILCGIVSILFGPLLSY